MTHEVPYLRAGAGITPAAGGCILQMADWRDCCGWSDRPRCVHPAIRPVAIKANDWLGDVEERSHFGTGYVVVRREDTSRVNWERMPYRRLVTQWERKRDAGDSGNE